MPRAADPWGRQVPVHPDPVADLWLRAPDGKALPAPLAVVTACRYTRAGSTDLVRIRKASDRGRGYDAVPNAELYAVLDRLLRAPR
jgi:hypothetical protein